MSFFFLRTSTPAVLLCCTHNGSRPALLTTESSSQPHFLLVFKGIPACLFIEARMKLLYMYTKDFHVRIRRRENARRGKPWRSATVVDGVR